MHGRPRKPPTDEDQLASSSKAARLRDLQVQVLNFHHNKIYTKEAMEISAKLLESNPEHYTGWNYRKLAVQFHLDQSSGNGDDPEVIQSLLNEELKVVEKALRRNLKSYGAWHHRKWVLCKGHLSTEGELRLLERICKSDPRNFHMWNYRRFIASLREIPDEEEFKYTTEIIEENFSNYSSWHNRSVLLCKLMENKAKSDVLNSECEFVHNALFTDPSDQSGWLYYQWLLEKTLEYEPKLISSWPPEGSSLYLLHDACFYDSESLPIVRYQSKRRMFPLILYFSEPVNCVSSSNVTVQCGYHISSDLNWRSLSAKHHGFSQSWLSQIEYPDMINSSEAFSVTVTISGLPCITSFSGKPFDQCHISFTVTMPSDDKVHSEVDNEHISWSDENFMVQTEHMRASFLHLLRTKRNNETVTDWRMDIISNELKHCKELEAESKIGKLTLARLLMARIFFASSEDMYNGIEDRYKDILKLYEDLMRMDPAHICYYEDMHSFVSLKQVISDVETLAKRCGQYRERCSSTSKQYLFARLNNLSISRISSIENFLWVQMLDLSHNKLRDIEGLEALQLLVCLNLGHNRIRSFTSLEPLKMLNSLQVLNISYNEIGAHSIDTRRYLCASPLTYSVESECLASMKDNWDAYLLFKDLNLVQLEITGNPVVDDTLRSFIFKTMPTLKWLDVDESHQTR